ncbi:hypothetical protein BEP19_11315 [Ammoniphilus oxalaticus]|uniref:DUF3231 family protein n=2 Tax=Ammoniphilus oxalaticus TaxID=66863 RepID=A0A419SHK4_9BACL|nr:hypothetical protein BEP19_11315 [Ammoniphilus oxalaticus]
MTSAEVSQIWSAFVVNMMFKAHLEYFLVHCNDLEIRSVLDSALQFSNKITTGARAFLNEEDYPTPIAFTEKDIHLDAPRLYTDHFYLYNIQNLSQYGMLGHSLSLSVSGRADIREFFSNCVRETVELYNRATEVLIKKGLYLTAPTVPICKQIDFVKEKSFLTGWLGERRPMTVLEINYIVANYLGTAIGRAVCMSFSQVARSKEIRAYFLRGSQIAQQHLRAFQSMLSEAGLPSIPSFESEVTNSTIAPFSDKLMMIKVVSLGVIASARYGQALGEGGRHDIGANYAKMLAGTLKFQEEGAKILIDRGWLEQPPTAVDRKALARV